MQTILHIDFNSYFATVEQQANPRLRNKPIGVIGGDRTTRTVIGAASIEAKRFGVKTGMQIWQAKQLCPQIILVPGDSDKYLETTKRFLNILKDYTPYVEVFSIDECFLELVKPAIARDVAITIKERIKREIGEYITCSIGISYNKLIAKLAGSLQKPDGLVVIANEKEAVKILDNIALDEICGIGSRIKSRLNKMGIFNFKQLRAVPLPLLNLEFKSYGNFLYNAARGIDYTKVTPFYQKEEIKSVGHRHTINHDSDNPVEIKQTLLKLTELIARRLRAKKLVGKTIHCYFRDAVEYENGFNISRIVFSGDGMQETITSTQDGLKIFKIAWKIFNNLWQGNEIRMIGVSVSNLSSASYQNISLLEENVRQEKIIQALDKINDKFGEFMLQRGILLQSTNIKRKPNSFLSDRRFKL